MRTGLGSLAQGNDFWEILFLGLLHDSPGDGAGPRQGFVAKVGIPLRHGAALVREEALERVKVNLAAGRERACK